MGDLADHLDWAKRNILTLAAMLLAFAAFAAELAGALPNGAGTGLAQSAVIATAAARGLVRAVEELRGPEGTRASAEASQVYLSQRSGE